MYTYIPLRKYALEVKGNNKIKINVDGYKIFEFFRIVNDIV